MPPKLNAFAYLDGGSVSPRSSRDVVLEDKTLTIACRRAPESLRTGKSPGAWGGSVTLQRPISTCFGFQRATRPLSAMRAAMA